MKILITGSSGFVGSALMPYLENLGHEVYGIDRDKNSIYPIHNNTVVEDIFTINTIKEFKQPFDLIIHCAAAKSDFGVSKQEYYRDNEEVTNILIDFAESRGVKKIVYYSTVSVYGHQKEACDEDGDILSNTVYGDSKLAGEKIIEKWLKKDENNKAIFLRPSVIYGTNNYANMYNLIDRLYGSPLFMVGNGKHVKSMVALNNLLDMTLFAIETGFKNKLDVYNCLDKPYCTVNELMEIIADIDGFKMPMINIPIWLAYILATPFEIVSKLTGKDLKVNWNRLNKFNTSTDYLAERIREKGYKQKYSTKEEITKMVNWYITLKQ